MILTYNALAATLFWLGDFEASGQNAMHGVRIWRSGGGQSYPGDLDTPVVGCLCYKGLCEWHLGEISSSHAHMDEAISLAKELKDWHALAVALNFAAGFYYCDRKPAEVERLALEAIDLSTRHNFAAWLATGGIYRGWARSVSGDTAQGIPWIEQGLRDYRATGAGLGIPFRLTLKAEALHLADCRSNLRRIPSPKSERVTRAWVPATTLLTHPTPLPRSPPYPRKFFGVLGRIVG
jgi:hypothetical protein